jgi:uncharacterized protein
MLIKMELASKGKRSEFMPFLAKIMLYPIKSLDGVAVEQATLLASSALQGDRVFALVDANGQYVNGKHNAKVHGLRSFFDLSERVLALRVEGTEQELTFHVDAERERLTNWLSAYFGFPVSIQQNDAQGYPDDLKAPGPTIIGASTLETVASWFPGTDSETFKQRFRANLELADAEPFWEDRLYGEAETVVRFRIGDVLFEGTNPCKRCVVPSRDPHNGQMYPLFQKTLAEKRAASLPAWANRSRFNHFYRLAVNTRVPVSEAGKVVRVGDEVVIEG